MQKINKSSKNFKKLIKEIDETKTPTPKEAKNKNAIIIDPEMDTSVGLGKFKPSDTEGDKYKNVVRYS